MNEPPASESDEKRTRQGMFSSPLLKTPVSD